MKWVKGPPSDFSWDWLWPAPHCVPSPLKQAAELESVSGSQHSWHVVQVHLRLARVEVLQGHCEGWGGSIQERAPQRGALQPTFLTRSCPSCWMLQCPLAGQRDTIRENAPALTWVQTLPGLPDSLSSSWEPVLRVCASGVLS